MKNKIELYVVVEKEEDLFIEVFTRNEKEERIMKLIDDLGIKNLYDVKDLDFLIEIIISNPDIFIIKFYDISEIEPFIPKSDEW